MIALWEADLDAGPAPDVLTADEVARRDRFAFPHLRTRFGRGRGLLRVVLGSYLGLAPREVPLVFGEQGKPALAGNELHFNLSHSDARWLLAVGDRPLGVDIEATRAIEDYEAMVRRFFAPAERAALFALPQEERHAAFFRGWTRKEAIMKATGLGMSLALDAFAVSLDATPRVLSPADLTRWRLRDLPAPPGFAAALAAEGDWVVAAARSADELT